MKSFKLFELVESDKRDNKKVEKAETPFLDSIAKDMTKMAEEGKLEPVIGRDKEVFQVLWVLSRKMKNNPVIIGEAGTGKTAIVEGIAQRIVSGKCPDSLKGMRILYIDMGSLIAGASAQGAYEKRLKTLIEELEKNKDIILFIDEIHMIVNPNASIDAANMFKPALARGEIRLIGATTYNEFRNSIEKDSALDRRFQKVVIKEPKEEETINILNQIKSRYEDYHNVKYTDDAIEACVRLSGRYITDRFFPDKAIDLLDEVGAKVRLSSKNETPDEVKQKEKELLDIITKKNELVKGQNFEESAKMRQKELIVKKQLDELTDKHKVPVISIDAKEVGSIVALKTGIPVTKLTEDESERLLGMENELKLQIIGQDEAVSKISKFVRRSRVGLKDPNRPSGVFMFLGSTGTGKCHGKGTKILMFDGSIKNVEDIREGEELMGDDSTPRKVLSLARGKDKMYKIKYKSGSFVCNSEHVLSLKETGKYNIVNIPLNEYLVKNKNFKHTHKLWCTGVDFQHKEVKIDPYLVGLWLGDGDKSRVGITTADEKIVNYIFGVSEKYGLHVNTQILKNNKSNVYIISGDNHKNNNILLDEFHSYGLIDKNNCYKKFIPDDYLKNSRQVRKDLLSGIIDSDGYQSNKGYLISTKYRELADQIVFLCKSLGYMAYKVNKKIKKYPDNEYFNVNISGDLSDLNILLERKKSEKRLQKKSVNLFGFEVEYLGEDDYYGFELDSNHLYLLGDFVVTHNTHAVKMLAKYIFGSESDLIRVDMSEFKEKHTVSRLIGSPPGYVGYSEAGQFTEKVRKKPFSIILLDEIEKAHPDVLTIFLQVFDDGHLTDSQGRKVDFKNTIIIMTSNVGAREASDASKVTPVGFGNKKSVMEENKKDIIKKALYNAFPPEFINRIDEVIIFSSLEKENIYKIIDLEIDKLRAKLKGMKFTLSITDNVKDLLMEVGYDSSMGARPLKRAIQTYIEDPIADEILRKRIKDDINVDYDKREKKLIINGNLITEKRKIKMKYLCKFNERHYIK